MKKLLYLISLSFFATLFLLPPTFAQGPAPDTASVFNSQYNFLANIRPSDYVTTAINIFLGLAGVAAFIYLLWGGVQWVTSGGDKDAIEKSRKRIMHALIGLAIVFSAYALILIIQILFGISTIWLPLRPLGVNLPPMPTYAPPPTRVPTLPVGAPTPTLIPTPISGIPSSTPTSVPGINSCYQPYSASGCGTCQNGLVCLDVSSYTCPAGMTCMTRWACVNPACPASNTCVCTPTPTTTAFNCAQTFNCRGANINVTCNNWCVTCSTGSSGGSCTGNGGLCVCSATP